MKEGIKIAGIGELLWDIFPDYKRLGGAPANFACHCNRLGADAYPISCVGTDELGRDIKSELKKMGVDASFVVETNDYPTGTVEVVLVAGKPTYQIHENVAWDHIPDLPKLRELAETLNAVCFGSLSQRFEESRTTIHSFISCMPEDSMKIFDVNLRQSFYSEEQIRESLMLANILKLSDEELPVLAEYFGLNGYVDEQLSQLRKMFDLRLVAYTRGPDGSLLIGADDSDDFLGCEGLAVDSVGAGDSFTAALCMGILRGWSLSEVNKFANEVATFVCSQHGATPMLPGYLVDYKLKNKNEEGVS